MFTVKTLNKIAPVGLNLLDKSNYVISDNGVASPHGILVRSQSMHEMDLPESLLAVARAGAGVNNIPIDKCTEKGIVVFNTPGANANAVKELTIMALLLASRKIVEGIAWSQSLDGQGAEVPKLIEKGKSAYVGPEIFGKKLGVMGKGAIGAMVAEAAEALGMEVQMLDSRKAEEFAAAIASCDYISLHCPLKNDTKGFFSAELFGKMKKGVRIINTSRAELVSDADMKQAIKDGIVACYVTDFPNQEMLNVENIIPIPHLGASTPESEDNCAVMAARQMKDFLENGNIINAVNFPALSLARSSKNRITVAHKADQHLSGEITTELSGANLQILNMVSGIKGSCAYMMMDIDTAPPAEVIRNLEKKEGVLRVRAL